MNIEIWKPVIDALPNIIWRIICISAGVIFLVKVVRPIVEILIINCNERKQKEMNFQHEQFWYSQKQIETSLQNLLEEKVKVLEGEKNKAEGDKKSSELENQRLQSELNWYKSLLEQIPNLKLPKESKNK